ncbi:MAG: class B sortase [Clostridia bacterium]|nr:class B sortase [Clostridia bacterium]
MDSRKYGKRRPVYRRGRRARRRSPLGKLRRAIPLLVCFALIVYGGSRLAASLLGRSSADKVNEELARIRAEAIEESRQEQALPTPTEAPGAVEAPAESAAPYQYIGETMLPESKVLHIINEDFVGWLSLPGVFDLPVVYRDNTYYVDHDFYGRKNDSGTLFLDEGHPFEEDSQYLFIHGHNVYDGSMLGTLTHYRKKEFVSEHPYIYFNTLYREETYEIFGVMQVTEEEMHGLLRLGTPDFLNGAEFNSFIESLRLHALRFTSEKLDPDDSILAVSTCWEEERIIVLYKRISP